MWYQPHKNIEHFQDSKMLPPHALLWRLFPKTFSGYPIGEILGDF